MHTRRLSSIANGNLVHRSISGLLVLGIVAAASGCSGSVGTTDWDGTGIKSRLWIGSSDDGSFEMQFNVRPDGASIVLYLYSLPCGEQQVYTLGEDPVRPALDDGVFETTIEATDLRPGVVITGKYIDKSHAEGTWQTSAFQSVFLDMACPAASGTWKGGPE